MSLLERVTALLDAHHVTHALIGAAALAAAGVARISHGTGPYVVAMNAVKAAAKAIYG